MAVFDGVHYSLSQSLSPARRNELTAVLDLNGATPLPPHTHLIALPASHPHTDATKDQHLSLVTDRWVDRSVVMGKRQPEQYYSPDPAMIFSGVVACATDLSAADLEVLSAGISALGGQWRIGLTRDVTHLFALRPGSDKYNTALHFASQTHMYILTPHWFDDAVRLGRRIPETPYTWPDPPILRPGMTLHLSDEPVASDGRRKRKLTGDTADDKGDGVPGHVDHVPVWAGRRILLSPSLEMGGRSKGAIEAGIHRAGGVVVPIAEDADEDATEKAVNECDVFITRWRSGKAYFKATRASLLIGTLSWLFSVESSGTLHSPLSSLIWYPTPRGGIPGLVDCEISITNYTGEARDYIKRLILLVGAKFTPSMTQSNKVLVAGFQPSPKTTRALSWSIPVVNHTWLEDCYVEWRALTVGLERYIMYPPGIDFGKMLMTRQDGSSASQPVSTPRSTGGAVPGGRGLNIIDVEEEETRDAEYRKHADDPHDAADPWKTHEADVSDLTGDVPWLEGDVPTESRTGQRSRGGSAKKTPPPSLRERLESVSTPLTASATGAFTDHVIEIPPEDDTSKEASGKRSTRAAGKQRGRASSIGSRTTSHSVSRPSTSRISPPTKDVEVVVSNLKDDSRAGRGKVAESSRGKDDGIRETRPSEDEEDAPRAARLAKPKSRSVKRKADNQNSQNDDDTRALQQALAKASKATRPLKGVATDPELSVVGAGEASDASVPPRRATVVGSMTPVKSGMKPRSRAKSISKARSLGEQSEDEGRGEIADFEIGTGAEAERLHDIPKSRNDKATTKTREKNTSDRKSEKDAVEPQGSDTNDARKRKRRLSLSISVPGDHFSSQDLRDTTDADKGRDTGKEKAVSTAKPATIARRHVSTTSMFAFAPEASSFANKRSKPSPAAKVSVTLLSGKMKPQIKTKAKPKATTSKEARTNKNDDGDRVDDSEISLIVDATPISRGGSRRSAANKATTRLREEIMPDVISFQNEQKQMKRRRSAGGESLASLGGEGRRVERGEKRRKLAAEVEEEAEEEEEAEVEDVVLVSSVNARSNTVNGKGKAKRVTAASSDDETNPYRLLTKKKPRGSQLEKAGREKAAIRLITTGLGLTDDVIKCLTKLGVQMTTKPTDCTHLVAKGIVRTEKFLCAMSVSPYILTKEWPNACAKSGKLLPESDYLLSDDAAEKKWTFKLADAMTRAKGVRGGRYLFEKMTFYLTPKISVDAKLLKNIVVAGGGQIQTIIKPTARVLKGKPGRYIVSCEEDKAIWRPLAQEGIKVYSTELLIRAALAQKIEWDRPESLITG